VVLNSEATRFSRVS